MRNNYKDFNNRSHKHPKLEDVAINTTYSFTISPDNSIRRYMDFDKIHEDIKKRLSKVKNIKVSLYPEMSDISLNYHFHGTLKFATLSSIFVFYKTVLRNSIKIWTWEIDTISDHKIWGEYCLKQQDKWKTYYKKTDRCVCINTFTSEAPHIDFFEKKSNQ